MSASTATTAVVDIFVGSAIVFILTFGLFLIYGLFRVVNMAHGDLVMLGAYFASVVQGRGISFWMSVLAAAAGTAIIALLIDLSCVGRLRRRSPLATMLATWGFSLILSQGALILFGPSGRYVNPPVVGQVVFLGGVFSTYQLVLLLVAIVIFGATWIFLKITTLGLHIRAVIDDASLAELQGVNTARLFSAVFALGGAFSGFAGAVLAPFSAINPNVGSGFSITSFMVLITGGLGNVVTAVSGALIVGGARSIIATFSSVTVATVATLAIVAIILAARRADADLG